MNFKNLEDKCRYYQSLTNYKLLPNSYILVHLDGKNFSKLIKNNFEKPFDTKFMDMMNRTAKFLCDNVQGCKIGYVQSDEISLLITDFDTPKTDTLFGGRLCKIQSILAAMATSEFNRWFTIYNLNKCYDNVNVGEFISKMKMAQFDCKCWVVPNENDAFAWFLYRNLECVRNSKQQAAQTYLPNERLNGKTADEQIEMLKNERGVDWNQYLPDEQYGRFIARQSKKFTKLVNGEEVPFVRNKFEIMSGIPLNEENNKEKFIELWK